MNENKKYLRITIYDNDFMDELEDAAIILYMAFYGHDKYPTKKDFPYLKKCIRNLMSASYCVNAFSRGDKEEDLPDTEVNDNYFIPELFIVKKEDIPDWENYESIYVPLFDDGDILKR